MYCTVITKPHEIISMSFFLSRCMYVKGRSIRAYLDAIQVTKDIAFKGRKSCYNYISSILYNVYLMQKCFKFMFYRFFDTCQVPHSLGGNKLPYTNLFSLLYQNTLLWCWKGFNIFFST